MWCCRGNVNSVNAIRSVLVLRRLSSSWSSVVEEGDQLGGAPVEGVSFVIDVLRSGLRWFAPSAVEQRIGRAHTCSGRRLRVVAHLD
jgi:hypothetical protein